MLTCIQSARKHYVVNGRNDKLALYEHERITRIYTVQNANIKRGEKHAECGKTDTLVRNNNKKRYKEFKRNRCNSKYSYCARVWNTLISRSL